MVYKSKLDAGKEEKKREDAKEGRDLFALVL